MAIDAYMAFQTYDNKYLQSESQVDLSKNKEPLMTDPAASFASNSTSSPIVFEVQDFSFDVEQTLNIGSASSGAGAGKIIFNPFKIIRKIDRASPQFFQMACAGTAFQMATLAFRKSVGASGGGADVSGMIYLRFDFKLVAVKTISWSYDDESPKETVTFEYGGLQVRYAPQNPDGSLAPAIAGGWNRVKNIQDTTATPIK